MRYKLWNKTDPLITPIGEVFEAEKYIAEKCPMAALPSVKIVVADAVINCSVFMEFSAMKAHYAALGVDFSGAETDQDVLDAITAFEEAPPKEPEPSDEVLMASAALIMSGE
jgi:hypothetical protein